MEAAGLEFAAESLKRQLIDVLRKQGDFLTEAWGVALMQHHRGILWALLLGIAFPAAGKVMSRVEQHVVLGSVEEAWALKKSFTQSFNMVAVAVRLTGI